VEEFLEWAKAKEPFHIVKWAIKESLVEGRFGWVRVNYSATLRRFPDLAEKETTSWQRWVLLDGRWYPVPQTELKNFPETPAIRDSAAEVALRARFDQTWRARHERDWNTLYSLTDPRDHEAVSSEEFSQSESLFLYLDAVVDWVEVIGDRGRVRVTYTHKPNDPSLTKMRAQRASIIENWVRVNQRWYRDLILQQG